MCGGTIVTEGVKRPEVGRLEHWGGRSCQSEGRPLGIHMCPADALPPAHRRNHRHRSHRSHRSHRRHRRRH